MNRPANDLRRVSWLVVGVSAPEASHHVLAEALVSGDAEKVAGLAGKTVTVTGFPVERNGIKGLQLQSVKPD